MVPCLLWLAKLPVYATACLPEDLWVTRRIPPALMAGFLRCDEAAQTADDTRGTDNVTYDDTEL